MTARIKLKKEKEKRIMMSLGLRVKIHDDLIMIMSFLSVLDLYGVPICIMYYMYMIPALPHCLCHQILKTSVIFKKLTYNSTIKSKRLRDTQNIFLFSFLASLYLLLLLLFLFVDANCRDYLGYICVCVCVKKAPLLRRIS